MVIEFSCPHCRQLVRTPPTAAGKKGRCPSCAVVVQIPSVGRSNSETPASGSAASTPPARTTTPASAGIEFYCVECGQLVRTPAVSAGKKGKCPNCKTLITIPHKAAGSKSSASATIRLTPLPRTPSADLTPLVELEPLGAAPVQYSPPALDLEPLLDEVLPELGPATQTTLPQESGNLPATNPFTSSATTGAWRRRVVNDLGRRGLPWERDPSLESYFDTTRYVLSAPGDAFLTMTRQGVGSPLGFFVVSVVVAILLALVLSVTMWALAAVVYWMIAHGDQPIVIRWEPLMLGLGGAACILMLAGLVIGLVGGIANAALFHVCLLLCGAANAGFTTTYRVVSFGIGSVCLLAAIPLVGPLFAFVMQPLVLTYGFMNAHETSGWRAFLAAILPTLLALALLFIVVLVNLPAILEAIQAATPAAA